MTAVTRHDTHVEVTPAGGEAEAFDEVVLACHADQALALLADPSDREAEILGAFGFQRNEAVLHTDERLLPRRSAARQAWNFHLLGEPKPLTTVTYSMNHLQRLDAPAQFCVTLNLAERDRPRARHPHHLLRAPGLHRRGPARAAPARRDQRRQPHALLRRVLALGLPRGRRRQRAAGDRRDVRDRGAGAAGRMRSAIYEGTVRHRRFGAVGHAFRHRVAMLYLDLDELPARSTPGRCGRRAGRRPGAFAAPTTSATPRSRWPRRSGRSSPSASAARRAAPCACSPRRARSGGPSTR